MSLLSKPFSAELREPKPSPAFLRQCRLKAISTRRGRFTKVTLPDGRSMTFVGPATKTEAVRNALSELRKHRDQEYRLVAVNDRSGKRTVLTDAPLTLNEAHTMRSKFTAHPDAAEDRKRYESYGKTWDMVGIWVEAECVVQGTIQRVRSGGLWGIESDSGKQYFREVAKAEYDQLITILKTMGAKKTPSFASAEWI